MIYPLIWLQVTPTVKTVATARHLRRRLPHLFERAPATSTIGPTANVSLHCSKLKRWARRRHRAAAHTMFRDQKGHQHKVEIIALNQFGVVAARITASTSKPAF